MKIILTVVHILGLETLDLPVRKKTWPSESFKQPQVVTIITFKIEQKSMIFDHDFGYSFPLFFSLLIKKEENENGLVKIVDKSLAFLLDQLSILQ